MHYEKVLTYWLINQQTLSVDSLLFEFEEPIKLLPLRTG